MQMDKHPWFSVSTTPIDYDGYAAKILKFESFLHFPLEPIPWLIKWQPDPSKNSKAEYKLCINY